MNRRHLCTRLLLAAALPNVLQSAPAHAAPPSPPSVGGPSMLTLDWRGSAYRHRWSRAGQHEFTPAGDEDLTRWRDMLTLNLHEQVASGEQLAAVANQVLANYQQHGGKILVTRSTPRTPERPAEHLIAAVLGTPQLLEAVFARCLMHEGRGLVAVVSHRLYGQAIGPQMSQWLAQNGPATEQALMGWTALPRLAELRKLPQSA